MMHLKKAVLTLMAISAVISANPFYGNILFEKGSSELTPDTRNKLDLLVQPLSVESLNKSGESLVITGYTDQSSEEQADTLLASRRAETVAAYVRNVKNIPADRIVVRGTNGFSYHILTVTAEGRRLNRRAEIVVRRVQKKDVPLILNIVEMQDAKRTTDSSMVLNSGDTITTGESGFARLMFGTRTTIDLDENSSLTISNKKIVLIRGKVQVNRTANDEAAPLFASGKSDVVLTGNGAIHSRTSQSLFVSVFSGSGAVNSPYGKKSAGSMEGIAVLDESSKIVATKLPTAPKVVHADSVSLIPGLTTPLTWKRSGESFRYSMSTSPLFTENLSEGITSDTVLMFGKPAGTWYVRFMAETAPGFNSLWSSVDSIVITKKAAVVLDGQFKDTLFTVSPSRPFTISGYSDPNTALYLDTVSINCGSDGRFTHSFMLNDDVNPLLLVSRNPDSSRDTLVATVLYNGADEIIDMNDSIVGREAFTTSRHYTFKGVIPNGTALKINGESIPFDNKQCFEKKFKLPGYEKIPVDMEVTYKNGHTKTIKRTIERIKSDTPIQQLFFTGLGIATVAALFVFIGIQSAQ